MERDGFVMRLLPGAEAEAEYRARHAVVWPEMLGALKAAGARNYSIILREEDPFGDLEVEIWAASSPRWPRAPSTTSGKRTCPDSSIR